MMDVCLIGTGGMMPLPERWLTSLMIGCRGHQILIDCGEGTQIAAKKAGLRFKPVDAICFTHFHADHIAGLPGYLLTLANSGRTEPLHLIGPKGLRAVVGMLCVISPVVPYPVVFHELEKERERVEIGEMVIDAFAGEHRGPCYGYSVSVPRKGKFYAEKAKALEIPVKLWGRIQNGEAVEADGREYTPEDVMGPPRKGLKVVYTTDTRPVPAIAEAARDADLFVCEGIYGDPAMAEKAVSYKHMTMQEAAHIAAEAQPREMWLTHFSPSMADPEDYIDEVRKIFPKAFAGTDGKKTRLSFSN